MLTFLSIPIRNFHKSMNCWNESKNYEKMEIFVLQIWEGEDGIWVIEQ